jgi:photosystem II stability/assembly factor-like uncharacterized protein
MAPWIEDGGVRGDERRGLGQARKLRVCVAVLALAFQSLGLPGQAQPPAGPSDEPKATAEWTSLGLGGGGAMFTPAVSPADPNSILVNCDMGGVYRTTDGGQNWELIHYQQLGGSTTVRPAWHPTDPAVAFAAGGWRGPLRITRDHGRSWSEVPSAPSRVTAIAIDPGNPDLILVGNRQGIIRSTDGGKTWQDTAPLLGRPLGFHFDRTTPADRRTCLAATERGVLRSDNSGETWSQIHQAPGKILGFTGGSNQAAGTCVLYYLIAGKEREPTTGAIYRSDDGGRRWDTVESKGLKPPNGPKAQLEFVLTSDVDPSRVYAARGKDGQVFRSDDRGTNWRPLLFLSMSEKDFNIGPNYLVDERGIGGETISGFGINPADPDHLVVTDWMNCYISRDGGKSWTAAHTRSAEVPGRRGKGMRWANSGLVVTSVWHYYVDPFEPQRHYIAYTDIGFARSTDAGKTWYWQTGRPLRNTTYELAFDPETPGLIWGAFSDLHDIPNNNVISGQHYRVKARGGVGVSTDFGASWKDSSAGLPGKPIVSVIVDPKSPRGSRALYASAFEDGVFKSTDNGRSWARASNGLGQPGGSMRVCRLILHPDGTLFGLVTALKKDGRYVAEGPGLYRTTDGGAHWTWINRSRPLLWPKDFDVDPRDSRVIYLGAADAANSEGGLYKTTNGGDFWASIARHGSDCFGASVDPRNPDRVYMCIAEGGGEPGLWRSDNGGQQWDPVEGLPFCHVQRVSFDRRDPNVIYVSTFGASAWRGPAR